MCDYHFGHDLIAIDQRETALGDWEQHFYSYDAFGIDLAVTGTAENAYR